jgi:hypothetical protein
MRRLLCALVLSISTACPVLAWSDAGHKIVASIAFSRLTPVERQRVVDILREHPRFKTDFLDAMPENVDAKDEWIFQQASVWPDIARGFRGDALKEFNHGTWHYINVPQYLNESDREALGQLKVNDSLDPPAKPVEEMNAIQTIKLARALLADANASSRDKATMMAWLFHLVGDIHQPLHSTALFSQKLFPEGDRGGNLIRTVQRRNLHSLWDGFPGGKVDLREAHQEALKLMANAELTELGERGARELDEKQWMDESHELCVNVVYGPDVVGYLRNREAEGSTNLQPIALSEEYLKAGGKICDRRVVQAGYRLAAVLKEIVDQPTPPSHDR